MEENKLIEFTRRHKVLLCVLAVIAIILLIASRFSFITIQVENADVAADINYSIIDTASDKISQKATKSVSYRKLVSKGSYSVSVSQNNKNYFAFVNMPGFFLNKKVAANLEPEKSRTFIGDNPDSCMQYANNVLLSYSCNGAMKTLKVHLPPTGPGQSTYAKSIDSSGDILEGTVRLGGEAYGLIKPVGPDTSSSPRIIGVMNASGVPPTTAAFHNELSGDSEYQMGAYKDGFIVYGGNLGKELFYYKNPMGQPEKVVIETPSDDKLSRIGGGTSKDSIAIAYANTNKIQAKDVHEGGSAGTTTVALLQEGKSKQVKVAGYITDLRPCGTKKLCVLENQKLKVYDVAGKNARLLYSLPGVQALDVSDNQVLVVTSTGVLALNADEQNGAIDYSFGAYSFCGIKADGTGYTLCLINSVQRRVALRIDRGKENTTNIDKKILELHKSKAVQVVSIYGNNITVVPNYGPPAYNSAKKVYEQEQTTINRMNNELNSDLIKIGINTTEYTVAGTSPTQ